MASFAELLSDVYEITNRPDLVTQTKMAIRSATLKAHHRDFYAKDLMEHGIMWGAPAYHQSLEYRTIDPRWRSMKFLRKYDASTTPGVPGDFFELITPELVLDEYSVQRTNVMYLAGNNYEIKSTTEDVYMLVGYYRHPNTTELSYDSWVALDHPFAIVYEAAAIIFKQTGFDEQAVLFRDMTKEQYHLIDVSNIQGVGY